MENYELMFMKAKSDPAKIKEFLLNLLNSYEKKEIDNIIETLKNMDFFNEVFSNVSVTSSFIDQYYSKYGEIKIFCNEQFCELLYSKLSVSDVVVSAISEKILMSDWFFEFIKPTNLKTVSIARFQYLIEQIEMVTGFSLQSKASKFYCNLKNIIRTDIDNLIKIKNAELDSLTDQSKEILDIYIYDLLIDSNYKLYFEYSDEYLSDEENKKLHILEKKLEQPLLYIKLYIDMSLAELFETMPTVAYKDIREMLIFEDNLPEKDKFLSTEPIIDGLSIKDIYSWLLTMGVGMTSTSQIDEFIEKTKKINISERLYDDMSTARKKSEDLIRSKLYKFSEKDLCKDTSIQNQYPNAIIYDLRDDDLKYNLIVRHIKSEYDPQLGKNHIFECYSYINQNYNHVHFSGGKNSRTSFNYGYYDIESNHLVFQSIDDSYTKNIGSYLNSNEQSILTTGDFPLDEINIVNDTDEDGYIPKKPDYIIAYNEITNAIYQESLRLNIPIVLLKPNSKEVECNNKFLISTPYYRETSSVDTDYLNNRRLNH